MAMSRSKTGQVYFLHNPEAGVLKVGFTTNPRERVKEHQTSNHAGLVLLGAVIGGREDEARVHRLLSEYLVPNRTEWFQAPPEVMHVVRMLLVRQGRPCTVEEELHRRED
jgi:hypothetical protein